MCVVRLVVCVCVCEVCIFFSFFTVQDGNLICTATLFFGT